MNGFSAIVARRARQFAKSAPSMPFGEASVMVVDYLTMAVPMGFWAVTRFDGLRQVYLEVRDDAYGLGSGNSHKWADSFCIHMVAGESPKIAADAMAVPEYAGAAIAQQLTIGSYVGVPITRSDGAVFGTLCGLDPDPRPVGFLDHEPMLAMVGGLLSTILRADLERADAARRLERAELAAESDLLTGLLNRRGWDRYLQIEEARARRFGDPMALMIIDLDGLKGINDTNGHSAGDAYIRVAGAVLRDTVGDQGIVARLGGDEFAVVATNLDARGVADLLSRIDAAFATANVDASIGCAQLSPEGTVRDAMKAADAAMYAEKQRRHRDRRANVTLLRPA